LTQDTQKNFNFDETVAIFRKVLQWLIKQTKWCID
jgi:hypothetical protein